jgi:hypothetical protein
VPGSSAPVAKMKAEKRKAGVFLFVVSSARRTSTKYTLQCTPPKTPLPHAHEHEHMELY